MPQLNRISSSFSSSSFFRGECRIGDGAEADETSTDKSDILEEKADDQTMSGDITHCQHVVSRSRQYVLREPHFLVLPEYIDGMRRAQTELDSAAEIPITDFWPTDYLVRQE